ncbi:hypothetical protein COLO4_29050 [Corchorus olitorius]|uniref:Leucine-rich repeat-containing N-terminal plant-type domain-containing protein n=1 Tax=Corchorus olitorius TaxID=93759 RepID=A0A1R3HGN0_9ROSI|nr:hypothetical protein COLO4_29050 [Corchorus olitorius]
MEQFLHCFSLKCLLTIIFFIIFPNYYILTQSVSSIQPPACWDSERSALLHFKESFILHKSASDFPLAYPKVNSWKVGVDCCSWDGVECDDNIGHVIGLDLSSSFLHGSIDSNSTLFHLHHLTSLNLSDNDFDGSKLPSAIGNLSRLSLLDLSFSAFSGQIPIEILELSELETLDLSGFDNYLELQNPSLKSLVDKLVKLKYLDLGGGVNVSSTVPQSLANLSSLAHLSLRSCDMNGEFPIEIFQLPKLQFLSVSANPRLKGRLPEFPINSSIESLWLYGTGFDGELPKSIGNLKSLSDLEVAECNFSGQIPSSLASLTHLTYLSLSHNPFSRGTLIWLGNQTKLDTLYLGNTSLYGDIPSSLKNLTQLTVLSLNLNWFSGQIPSWIGNLTRLTVLDLHANELRGPIPQSLFNLVNLEVLDLHESQLSGTVNLEQILQIRGLTFLQLSGNDLSVLTTTTKNASVPKFKFLALGSCNLSEFPDFLDQDELEFLSLGNNKIDGRIPKWLWGSSAKTLEVLDLQGNLITGFDQPYVAPPWTNLRILNLVDNMLQGPLPIPPASIYYYFVENNSLTGELTPMICNLSFILVLDVSNNNLSGVLPPCLSNLSRSLSVLNLQNNSFRGLIPTICERGSQLRMIDFSQNQLDGQILSSMVDCRMLESLNLASNRLKDAFPSQLGKLPELKILILRQNEFHGAIGNAQIDVVFPKLRILDLSFNKFAGPLPSRYFQRWNAMKVVDFSRLKYLQLRGPIPQGKQFATFDNNSFVGNPGLCGEPLSKKCYSEASPPPPRLSSNSKKDGGDSLFEFGWKIVVLGYGVGVMVGLILGYTFNPWKHKWFLKYFWGSNRGGSRGQGTDDQCSK